jgi:prepilin-type N-terminal cleavage/methylation domain-containing protein
MLFIPDFRLSKVFKIIKLLNKNLAQKRAFTLVEVLVSAVILSVGLVFIFQVFLNSLDIVNMFNNQLNAQLFLNEKIGQLQTNLNQQAGLFMPMKQSGVVRWDNREFNWQLDLELVDLPQELYLVNAQMSWLEGRKQRTLKRQAMVKSYFDNAALGR